MLRRLLTYKWIPALIIVAVIMGCLALFPVHSWADSVSEACSGAGLTVGSNGKCGGGGSLDGLFKVVVNVLSAIVGLAAVIMVIIGGFKYITSGGDSNKVAGAKSTIIYAIVGLLVVAMAQVIVHFVIKSAA